MTLIRFKITVTLWLDDKEQVFTLYRYDTDEDSAKDYTWTHLYDIIKGQVAGIQNQIGELDSVKVEVKVKQDA